MSPKEGGTSVLSFQDYLNARLEIKAGSQTLISNETNVTTVIITRFSDCAFDLELSIMLSSENKTVFAFLQVRWHDGLLLEKLQFRS